MTTITLLPSAKVPLIYDGELTMTTEWYRFFWNIYGFTGTGVVPVDKGGTGLTGIGEHQLIIGNAAGGFDAAELIGSGISITYGTGTVTLSIGASGVTPGTYGTSSSVGQFTINQYGSITFAQNLSIAIDASQIVSGTIASARISGAYPNITGVGVLTAGTWNANTITASYGGTGQSSYAIGDLLYASSTSALSKLVIGANNYILASNGTAPNWIAPSTIAVGTATNLAGGTANQIPYQTGAGATSFIAAPTVSNTYLNWSGTAFQWTANPLGTVTSVGLSLPTEFTVTNSPVTTSGTLTGSWASQTAKYFFAAPNATAGTPSFRAIVASDIPALAYVTSVSGTGTVNGITLTGTVTSSGSLTLGGTLSGIGNSQLTNSTISGVALGGNLFSLTAGTGVSFSAGTTYNGSAAITINATGTGGTVTSVAALTLGTTGTDLSSTVANSTTTPVITLNVPTASATNRGALSAADWTTFNNKQPAGSYLTAVSVVSANGFAGTSSGGTTPALTLSTTITGLLKGNGTAISAATSGTDYAPATSGTSILYGNGAGGFSNVTVGTGLTFVGGTLASTASGGTVTSVTLTTGTTGLTVSGGTTQTITSSGTFTIAGTLAAANGGTGQSSYAVGDILYASTTTALSKLADVATGNALISGGVGAAPSYGKIGLTTHISGTLSVANGGTGLTAVTAGYIPFGSSASALNTDGNFFWDVTNHRLGLGTGTPNDLLEVYGTARFSRVGAATQYTQLLTGASGFSINNTASSGQITMSTNGGTTQMVTLDGSGNFLIGQTASAGSILEAKAGGEVSALDRNTAADGVIIRYRKQGATVGYISTNTYTLPSDQRVKKNIAPLSLGLDFICDLNAVEYNTLFQDQQKLSRKNYGLIAQQVEAVLAKHGKSINDVTFLEKFEDYEEGESQYGLGYQNLVPVLIKAIQELKAQFDTYVATHP